MKTLALDIGIDDGDHFAHAQSITDALAAFEELEPADRSDEATSDEDEENYSSSSSYPPAAPPPADHLEVRRCLPFELGIILELNVPVGLC